MSILSKIKSSGLDKSSLGTNLREVKIEPYSPEPKGSSLPNSAEGLSVIDTARSPSESKANTVFKAPLINPSTAASSASEVSQLERLKQYLGWFEALPSDVIAGDDDLYFFSQLIQGEDLEGKIAIMKKAESLTKEKFLVP